MHCAVKQTKCFSFSQNQPVWYFQQLIISSQESDFVNCISQILKLSFSKVHSWSDLQAVVSEAHCSVALLTGATVDQ